MNNKYFTLILKDNFDINDRFKVVGKIVEVEIKKSGIHYIVGVFDEPPFHLWKVIDLGYYNHKLVDNKLWNLVI